jgi:hypothetical protein
VSRTTRNFRAAFIQNPRTQHHPFNCASFLAIFLGAFFRLARH